MRDANNVQQLAYYRRYYNSKEHYKTMVDPSLTVFGCSNTFFGPNEKGHNKQCQYDVYVDRMDTYAVSR